MGETQENRENTQVRWPAIASVIVVVCGHSNVASSQEWVSFPSLTLTSSYETNPDLDPDQERSNSLYSVNPSVISQLEFPTSSLEIDLAATLTRSRNQAISPDTETYDIGAAGEKALERSSLTGSSRVTLEEFENSDFDDDQALSAVDSSAANEDDTVQTIGLSGGYSREVTEIVSTDIGLSFTSTEFSDDARTDSKDYRVNNGWSYALNDLLSATTNGSIQYFDPEDDDTEITFRLTGGANYVIDEEHSIRGNFGIVSNQNDTSFILNWAQVQSFRYFDVISNSNFDLTADDDGELQRTSISDISIVHPISDMARVSVGAGYADTGDTVASEINGQYEYDFTDFVSASLAVSARQIEESGDNTGTDTTTDELVLTPSLNWRFSEEVSALGRYDEIRETADGTGTAISRRATITINYNLPPL